MNPTEPASHRPDENDCVGIRLLGSAFILSMGLAHGETAQPSGDLHPESLFDSDIAVTSFEQVWTQVRDQYFNYGRIEADWNAARSELYSRVVALESRADLRDLLNELLSRIGESHFSVIPREVMTRLDRLQSDDASAGPASTGLSVRLVDDRFRATRVIADSPAWQASIRPGWTLVELDGEPLSATLDELASPEAPGDSDRARRILEIALDLSLAFPDADRTLRLAWVDQQGQAHEVELRGDPAGVDLVQLGNLPPMVFEWRLERIEPTPTEQSNHCVTRLNFSTWVPEINQVLQARRDEWMQCPALIIDLRGNLGGVMSTMVTLAADLFEEPVTLGSLLRRDGQFDFRVLPRRVAMDGQRLKSFDGPIAILVDRLSASTSEMFASGMQASGRARLFGETTAGMALPAGMLPLASGDSLMYAFADYRDGAGRRIEGAGVMPDVAAPLSSTDLEHSVQRPLNEALDWIAESLRDSSGAPAPEAPKRSVGE